jgi:hypothetical protein
MRPFVPCTVAPCPGDGYHDAGVPLLDAINAQVVIPFPAAPLDR